VGAVIGFLKPLVEKGKRSICFDERHGKGEVPNERAGSAIAKPALMPE